MSKTKAELQEIHIPTVIEIVEHSLRTQGYDGLFDAYGDCACILGDLSPADCMTPDCLAGYKWPCNCGEGHEFHVGVDKAVRGD